MKVAILGAGGIAYSYAAFLASRSHQPMIWSPSGTGGKALAGGSELQASGALEGSFRVPVAESLEVLLSGAEAIVLALPAYGHKTVIDKLVPRLLPGQSLILSAHLSFLALYVSRSLTRHKLDNPIIVWNTSASTGRKVAPDAVSISMLRAQVEMAVIPARAGQAALTLCETLFGQRFVLKDDLIGVDLGNLNPALHLAVVMFNLTRIERAETWMQNEHLTPAVCRLLEDLDRERLGVAEALDASCRTVHQAYAVPGQVEIGPLEEMMVKISQLRRGVAGPRSLSTRYVTEDVPYGLLTTVRLAELAAVDVPLHRAGILIFSSLYGRNFVAENQILPEIADAFTSPAQLRRVTREGWAVL